MNCRGYKIFQKAFSFTSTDGNRENAFLRKCPEEAKILDAFWKIC